MATYAVGDLQGCLDPLLRLLSHVDFNPSRDTLWLAGDLVNRGPESLQVLRFLYHLQDCVQVVLGNHDLHLLAMAAGVRRPGSSDTIDSILKAPDRKPLLAWLRRQPLIHHNKALGYTMVHAGIPPIWSLKKAKKRAQEVEAVLQSRERKAFFHAMYGNSPNCWNTSLQGQERLRVITNYLTRMRFCKGNGELELTTKSKAAKRIKGGYRPWFAYKKRKTANDRILFGHWAALEGRADADNVFALDTGYVWGGALTMMCLEDGQRYQVKA